MRDHTNPDRLCFLVTGADSRLFSFRIAVRHAGNIVERRGQTVLYTCLARYRAAVLVAAVQAGVTVQEWNGQEWAIIIGDGLGRHEGDVVEMIQALATLQENE